MIVREDLDEAAAWLAGRVIRTPVIRCAPLDVLAGARLWLKAENLQRGGSYKFRGAMHAVGRAAERGATGIVTQSSGNLGIAVAMAAAEFGLPATVVSTTTAEQTKMDLIREHGAETIQVTGFAEECRAIAEHVRDSRGHTFVDSYGDHDVITGLGTAALELIEDAGALDALIVPVSSACGLAGAVLAAGGGGISVYGAEPAAIGGLDASLLLGKPARVEPEHTIADALVTRGPGSVTFDLVKDAVSGAIPVKEDEIARAVTLALFEAKLLLEPAAAVGLAAALGGLGSGHQDIGIVLTGGNVSHAMVKKLVGDG
ncbi:threonine ammonia-lyase [Nonomuraea lactucae]|uniref:threonine ammonia-lyase n=1 Tax=Nonomuraea lactucae TaxID=2249762 RepID=UPI0013B36872|nr:pyridoxal-phosphate dependent enzyme [Nonomuraea lactucae]